MQLKKVMSMFLLSLLIFSISGQAFAAAPTMISKKNISGSVVEEYLDKGISVKVYRDPKGINKGAIEKSEKSQLATNSNLMALSSSYYFSGAVEASDPNCEVLSDGYISAKTFSPHELSVYGGQTKGRYFGSSNPQGIVVRQMYSFDGFAASVSWPPGFSGSSTVREWVSEKYNNTWRVDAERENATGSCLISLFSVTVTDGSDVYVNNKIYKARYTIKKGIWDFSL